MNYGEWKQQREQIRARLAESDRLIASSRAARERVVAQDSDPDDEKLSGFLAFLDLAIKHGREAGLSDEYMVLGMRNRLTGGQGENEKLREPGGIMALARARGVKIGNRTEYQAFKNSLKPETGPEKTERLKNGYLRGRLEPHEQEELISILAAEKAARQARRTGGDAA